MAPRKLRRKLQGKKFRPVYYHGIPVTTPHKAVIKALKVKDRPASMEWARQVSIGLGLVLWGTELGKLALRQKKSAMKIRHDNLKLQGLWVERNIKIDY